jgi:hypothetical protein
MGASDLIKALQNALPERGCPYMELGRPEYLRSHARVRSPHIKLNAGADFALAADPCNKVAEIYKSLPLSPRKGELMTTLMPAVGNDLVIAIHYDPTGFAWADLAEYLVPGWAIGAPRMQFSTAPITQ